MVNAFLRTLSSISIGAVATYFWLPVSLVAVWWFASANSQSFFLPPLSEILHLLWTDLMNGTLVHEMLFSMRNVLLGLLISLVLGLGLGLLIGHNKTLRTALWPFLAFLRAVPGVAVVPVVLVAMGVGPGPQIFINRHSLRGHDERPSGWQRCPRTHCRRRRR